EFEMSLMGELNYFL
ncbi:DUF4219 domain-containing protein/UBN2 domain-containing protein, partial [Cephalotus follicularis]